MSKIEVGEYVRTDNGYIIKIDENTNIFNLGYKEQYVDMETTIYGFTCEEEIVKHSKQLIDLIEVGDYVNGHRVVNEIWGEDDNNLYFEIEGGFNKAQYIGEKDIQTILTEESYMANCYKKVGGEDEELTI